jgi:hypothetical protein
MAADGSWLYYRLGVGFNPFRPAHKDRLDLALVAGAILITLALLAWAIWG